MHVFYELLYKMVLSNIVLLQLIDLFLFEYYFSHTKICWEFSFKIKASSIFCASVSFIYNRSYRLILRLEIQIYEFNFKLKGTKSYTRFKIFRSFPRSNKNFIDIFISYLHFRKLSQSLERKMLKLPVLVYILEILTEKLLKSMNLYMYS